MRRLGDSGPSPSRPRSLCHPQGATPASEPPNRSAPACGGHVRQVSNWQVSRSEPQGRRQGAPPSPALPRHLPQVAPSSGREPRAGHRRAVAACLLAYSRVFVSLYEQVAGLPNAREPSPRAAPAPRGLAGGRKRRQLLNMPARDSAENTLIYTRRRLRVAGSRERCQLLICRQYTGLVWPEKPDLPSAGPSESRRQSEAALTCCRAARSARRRTSERTAGLAPTFAVNRNSPPLRKFGVVSGEENGRMRPLFGT